jgi:hypothetical protein
LLAAKIMRASNNGLTLKFAGFSITRLGRNGGNCRRRRRDSLHWVKRISAFFRLQGVDKDQLKETKV